MHSCYESMCLSIGFRSSAMFVHNKFFYVHAIALMATSFLGDVGGDIHHPKLLICWFWILQHDVPLSNLSPWIFLPFYALPGDFLHVLM
jgi:hypothetical protein